MTAETADLTTSQRVVRQYYETTSSREPFTPAMMDRQIATIERLLGDWAPQKGEVVVDLGSGMGETCAAAAAHGAASVTGINLSASENALARSIVPQATFVEADIVAGLAALPDASVDRITALNILEHLDKQVLAATLDQAMRVLKPGGSLIAMTPNAGSPFGTMSRYWDITHELAFTPSAFIQIGRLCGFSRFDFRECGPRPHGVVSGIRYVLWQAIRLGIKIRLMIELASTKSGIYTADMLTRLTK